MNSLLTPYMILNSLNIDIREMTDTILNSQSDCTGWENQYPENANLSIDGTKFDEADKSVNDRQFTDINDAFNDLALRDHNPVKAKKPIVSAKEVAEAKAQQVKVKRQALSEKEQKVAAEKAQKTTAKAQQVVKKTPVRLCEDCDRPLKQCLCGDDYDSYR